jgi:two-component sensor histidine kinase
MVRAAMARLRAGDDIDIEFRVFTDGDVRWKRDRGRAERDTDGRVIGAVGASIDITLHKRREGAARLLIRELDHRVKNNLATIATLAEMSFARHDSVSACRTAFLGRLKTLSLVHEALAASEWHGVALRDLIMMIVSPVAPTPDTLVTGELLHIHLASEIAEPLALVFQELCRHALTAGAWSVPGGRVEIEVQPALLTTELRWREVRPCADIPLGASDGVDLVFLRGLVEHQLRGRVDVIAEPPGTTTTVLRWVNPFQTESEIVVGRASVPPPCAPEQT